MEGDPLRYDKWIEESLRWVVRRAIEHIAANGLPGEHHFYVTFQTAHPGVRMPPYLRTQYPEEMTIVLQNRFWDLETDDVGFAVSLSFSGKNERLVVPYAALIAFADPSVKFGLQLKLDIAEAEGGAAAEQTRDEGAPSAAGDPDGEDTSEGTGREGNVVTLDAFRKK